MSSAESRAGSSPPAAGAESAPLEKLKQVREAMLAEIRKVIVGQSDVIDSLLLALYFRVGIVCWWACRGWPKR